MPARNMAGPSSVPANPSAGKTVLMNPFSGPKGSPFDKDQSGNHSTGALSTGIGFGGNFVIGPTAPASIKDRGFSDDYIPGVSLPSGVLATNARLTCIGGGKSTACVNGIAPTVPYNAQPLLAFGEGGSRDAGAGPAYTGFGLKTVTATGSVATGAAIEAGFLSRNTRAMVSGESAFGNSNTASAAVA